MFALFFKHPNGQLKFISDAATSRVAVYLGKRWSLENQTSVVGFQNGRDGSTRECCHFENGELIGAFMETAEDRRVS